MTIYKKFGILGSGQLGQMFTQAAQKIGAEVHTFSPEANSPTKKAGATEHVASYLDKDALLNFLDQVQALSFEFENIPDLSLEMIRQYAEQTGLFVAPSPESILVSRHRVKEKTFFNRIGLKTTDFFPIYSLKDLKDLPITWAFPSILKTNTLGYDGKGQWKISSKEVLIEILSNQEKIDHILERIVPFEKEISVIIGRFKNGETVVFPPSENIHTDHILDLTIHPARIPMSVLEQSIEYANTLAKALDYVGILGLEMFWTGSDLICNEFAPRPHNSGHFTMDACPLSQFDIQALILFDAPPTREITTSPVVMKNIIGPNFFTDSSILFKYQKDFRYQIYLYQKSEAKQGRKMGHINFKGSLEDSGFQLGQDWKQ